LRLVDLHRFHHCWQGNLGFVGLHRVYTVGKGICVSSIFTASATTGDAANTVRHPVESVPKTFNVNHSIGWASAFLIESLCKRRGARFWFRIETMPLRLLIRNRRMPKAPLSSHGVRPVQHIGIVNTTNVNRIAWDETPTTMSPNVAENSFTIRVHDTSLPTLNISNVSATLCFRSPVRAMRSFVGPTTRGASWDIQGKNAASDAHKQVGGNNGPFSLVNR